jgi:hypothetical protein
MDCWLDIVKSKQDIEATAKSNKANKALQTHNLTIRLNDSMAQRMRDRVLENEGGDSTHASDKESVAAGLHVDDETVSAPEDIEWSECDLDPSEEAAIRAA